MESHFLPSVYIHVTVMFSRVHLKNLTSKTKDTHNGQEFWRKAAGDPPPLQVLNKCFREAWRSTCRAFQNLNITNPIISHVHDCRILISSIRFISAYSLNIWFRSTKKESHYVLLASRVLLYVLFRFKILSNAFYRVQCNEPFCWNFNCFDFSTACPVLWPKCTPLCCFECCCSCQQIKKEIGVDISWWSPENIFSSCGRKKECVCGFSPSLNVNTKIQFYRF